MTRCSICLEANSYLAQINGAYMCGNCESMTSRGRIQTMVEATLKAMRVKWHC